MGRWLVLISIVEILGRSRLDRLVAIRSSVWLGRLGGRRDVRLGELVCGLAMCPRSSLRCAMARVGRLGPPGLMRRKHSVRGSAYAGSSISNNISTSAADRLELATVPVPAEVVRRAVAFHRSDVPRGRVGNRQY